MSHIVCVCSRDSVLIPDLRGRLEQLARRLAPDEVLSQPPRVFSAANALTAVFDPQANLHCSESSVALGMLFNPASNWGDPGAPPPDGSFALFRSDGATIEVVADAVASRTVWYVHTPDLFLASTSQRALVALLGDFQPDRRAFAWMLSAGNLGPVNAWDERFHWMRSGSRVRLDRKNWRLRVEHAEPEIRPGERSRTELLADLAEAMNDVFRDFRPDFSHWALPLSGGYDSRAILLHLPQPRKARSITWGSVASLDDPASDGSIARRLAEHFGLKHAFVPVSAEETDAQVVLDRFVTAAEGRTDHLSGYADGFQLWRDLRANGILGVIRGDEPFDVGRPVRTGTDVFSVAGLNCFQDFANLGTCRAYDLPEQRLPVEYQRRNWEPFSAWRDRLYPSYRMPVTCAALNGVKSAYVEVANPLVSRRLLQVARSLPPHERAGKALFRDYVRSVSPPIPFAKRTALSHLIDVLRAPELTRLVLDELHGSFARDLLPRLLLDRFLPQVTVAEKNQAQRVALKRRFRRIVPPAIVRALKNSRGKQVVPPHRVAFRAYLISRTCRMLQEDARAGFAIAAMPKPASTPATVDCA